MLPSLLLFPPGLDPSIPAPQEFALQFWDSPQKPGNAALVVGIMGMLIASKGGSVRQSSFSPHNRLRDLPATRSSSFQPLSRGTWVSKQYAHNHQDSGMLAEILCEVSALTTPKGASLAPAKSHHTTAFTDRITIYARSRD